MEKILQIPLENGLVLKLNVASIKNFFDSCGQDSPAHQMQAAVDAVTGVCDIVAKKNPDMAQHIMDVATLVMANAEIA